MFGEVGQRLRVPKRLRVISRPSTVPADRSIDLNAELPATCSIRLGSSFGARGVLAAGADAGAAGSSRRHGRARLAPASPGGRRFGRCRGGCRLSGAGAVWATGPTAEPAPHRSVVRVGGQWAGLAGFAAVAEGLTGGALRCRRAVVLSMGANDATGLCAPLQWVQLQNRLAELIT